MPNCKQCNTGFEITDKDREFYEKLSIGFKQSDNFIAEPDKCFLCRQQARLVFRNERYYYQRKCDLCRKAIISTYDPEHTKNVYCNACWWGDGWNPKNYGKAFDFDRPFFDQYKELLIGVPKIAMMNDNGSGSENSEYTYDCSSNKNAYLVIGSWHVEDGMYGWQTNHVKNVIDNCYIRESELMYDSLLSERCYNCQDCMQCEQCSDCIFGFDLKGCKDCILSAGLRSKQYCIFNQPYSKEEYFKKKNELQFDSWEKREQHRKLFADFLRKRPQRYANLVNCENCTGDYLMHCKDAKDCYNHWGLQSCRFMTNGDGAKDCYDCYSTGGPELCYSCITPDNSYATAFSVYCWKSQFILYSDNCHSSSQLFGCVGMKQNKHCILNKQYTQEEYENLLEKIVDYMKQTGEWGEFFRPDISLFAYNETPAQQFYPLNETQVLKMGYRYQKELPGSFAKETVHWSEVPDRITEIEIDGSCGGNHIVKKEIFRCIDCGRNFKILECEFQFYKKGSIPLPRLCIDCRYHRRMNLMNPRRLYDRHCDKCGASIKTTFAPDRPEKVYCEACYLKEVY